MKPLYSLAKLRELELQHQAAGLIEQAGLAAANFSKQLLGLDGDAVLVMVGPGNNGGDALVAARYLKTWWHRVTVVFTGQRNRLPQDAAHAYEAWLACGGEVLTEIPAGQRWHLLIDGLFGIGLQRDLDAHYRDLIATINQLQIPILSLDIPSGLCMRTGRVLDTAIRADHTLTFIGLKPGLFTLDGPDHAGHVQLADLGIDAGYSQGSLLDDVPAMLRPRKLNSHKGSNGSVGVIGGAEQMVGAALLAGRAALLLGAGRVYCGVLAQQAPAVDEAQPELMLRQAESLMAGEALAVLAVGPGMGQSAAAAALLEQALRSSPLLLLDADALNLVAGNAALRRLLQQRQAGTTVITPHPGEAATLLVCSTQEIQQDRVVSALKLAVDLGVVTVLKGCGSVIALPDGRWYINHSGNPGLASAGMGDTLAGMIAALAAQGLSLEQATLLGVYLHGRAADDLVAQGIGPIGLTASEVAHHARTLLNRWVKESGN
ncbi:NAD(P)H-hydrate dehydratase [Methylobacillus gramineus]|nr:NAD(P)H-hydrate dehydratase [Methylobacillus gramineus]